ncbi:MAG: hypothetical protein CM1200mP29_16980 [Verrucomicrobiota bacterium]|nr:MAG: hypothetical protein CM1200mP29_16980 [Verrucomicrobiota bacterium]
MLRRILVLAELPFAGDGGRITGGLELMGEGGLLAIQPAELHVIPDVYWPVMIFARDGVQMGLEKQLVKRTPLGASLSRLGDFRIRCRWRTMLHSPCHRP